MQHLGFQFGSPEHAASTLQGSSQSQLEIHEKKKADKHQNRYYSGPDLGRRLEVSQLRVWEPHMGGRDHADSASAEQIPHTV